VNFC